MGDPNLPAWFAPYPWTSDEERYQSLITSCEDALGWKPGDANAVSLHYLRDILASEGRSVLAAAVARKIQTGDCITKGPQNRARKKTKKSY